MASPWCRLWSDMPNDPKWRTIARASGQSIGNVIAVYVHMMTCASSQPNATERGQTIGWCDEDIATALDIETGQVVAIRDAMEGRVRDGDHLSGWDRRQSVREDEGAAQRAKEWREREKAKKDAEKEALKTQPNATERNRTTEVEVDIEVDKKRTKVKTNVPPSGETAEVFAYWQKVMDHPQAKLVAKRETVIKGRLKEGYTVQQLCQAIDGCKLSPHHMGKNDTGTVYDDIELICRDATKVDKFIGWATQAPVAQAGKQLDEKFHFGNLDRSGDQSAMDASMKKHGIVVPQGEINF